MPLVDARRLRVPEGGPVTPPARTARTKRCPPSHGLGAGIAVCWSVVAVVLHPGRGSVQVTSKLSRLVWCPRRLILCVHAERFAKGHAHTDVAEAGAVVTIGLVVPGGVIELAPLRTRGGVHADTARAMA